MSLITALIFKALGQLFMAVARRNARPWAEGLAYSTIRVISRGLPADTAAMMHRELKDELDQRIWLDLKRGISNEDMAISALGDALNLLREIAGLRAEYAATTATAVVAVDSTDRAATGRITIVARRGFDYLSQRNRGVFLAFTVAVLVVNLLTAWQTLTGEGMVLSPAFHVGWGARLAVIVLGSELVLIMVLRRWRRQRMKR